MLNVHKTYLLLFQNVDTQLIYQLCDIFLYDRIEFPL